MRTFVYDRSFEGLLTAVFHAYARREFPDFLAVEGEPGPLFVEERFRVVTDEVFAARVWRGLEQRAGKGVCNMVLCVWLSEEEGADMLLFRYLCRIFGSPHGVEYDTSDEADGVQGGEGGAPAHAVRAFPEGGRWQLFCTRIAAV